MHSLFQEMAAANPDAVAVEDASTRLTYSELNRRANRLAWRLIGRHLLPEGKVAIAMERSTGMIVAMLGVLKAGGTYVPIDPQLPVARLNLILEDTAAALVVTDATDGDFHLPAHVARIGLDDAQLSGAEGDRNPPELSGPKHSAYVMYTSGSTGKPKGVEIVHRGIVRLVKNSNYFDPQGSDRFGQIANPMFDAITFEVWGALLNGAQLTVIPSHVVLSPQRFGKAIRDEGITTMFLTASLFTVMAATEPAAFGSMRTLIVGGDAVDPGAARTVLKTAPPARLVNGYGPTECTTFSVCHWIKDVPENAASIPIGRPISNSRAYVLDAGLQPTPPGTVGDLYLGGDGLARGYLNQPELTAERFIPDPFDSCSGARLYKTGDRARWTEDGFIDFVGRVDHQVKFHGFRIELGEIETALRRHPAVVDAAVLVCRASQMDERLVAYVSSNRRDFVSESDLRRYLTKELPAHMVPSHVMMLESLPLNAVGKVDRRALQDRGVHQMPVAATKGMATYEEQVCQVWREVLSLDQCALTDNFFDVGGTSLTLALVEHRLKKVIETEFEITDLFRYPTISSFCAFCRREVSESNRTATNVRAENQRKAFRARPSVART